MRRRSRFFGTPLSIAATFLGSHFKGCRASEHGAGEGVDEALIRDAYVFAMNAAARHESLGLGQLVKLGQGKYRADILRGAMYRN